MNLDIEDQPVLPHHMHVEQRGERTIYVDDLCKREIDALEFSGMRGTIFELLTLWREDKLERAPDIAIVDEGRWRWAITVDGKNKKLHPEGPLPEGWCWVEFVDYGQPPTPMPADFESKASANALEDGPRQLDYMEGTRRIAARREVRHWAENKPEREEAPIASTAPVQTVAPAPPVAVAEKPAKKRKRTSPGQTPEWFAHALVLMRDGLHDAAIERRLEKPKGTLAHRDDWKAARKVFMETKPGATHFEKRGGQKRALKSALFNDEFNPDENS